MTKARLKYWLWLFKESLLWLLWGPRDDEDSDD